MSSIVQLDLFGDRPDFGGPMDGASGKTFEPERLSDSELISIILDATLADANAIAAEVGQRRLVAAVPALASLCDRFAGYGAGALVPEQSAALDALGAIGGPEAARVVLRLIAKRIVQGPTLAIALTVASEIGVVLPNDLALSLLRDPIPSVRAAACSCVRLGYGVITTLAAMLDDPDGDIAISSACALGRMGRTEALAHLKRHLFERPSPRVVEALARVADDEAVVFLARIARSRRELTDWVISALEEIESPRALNAFTHPLATGGKV